MNKLLRDVEGTISLSIYDSEGELTDADAGVLVTVVDGSGLEGPSGNAEKPAGTTGLYEFRVNLHELDIYTAIWTAQVAGAPAGFVTHFEVAGGFYFAIAEAREREPALAEKTAAQIRNAREYAEEAIEAVTDAFVPRGRRLTLDGTGTEELFVATRPLRRALLLAVDDAEIELAELAPYPDRLVRTRATFPRGRRNVKVWLEYGHDQPPEPVKRAAMILAAAAPLESAVEQERIGDYAVTYPRSRAESTGNRAADALLKPYRPVAAHALDT